jgi:hypothetical protein
MTAPRAAVALAVSLVAGLAAALLGGCSSSPNGSVTGVVHVYGGPSLPTGQAASTGQATAGQEVVVEDAQHHRTTAVSDASGHYTLSLPVGTYTLMCGSMPQFTVTAGQAVALACDLAVA